MLTSYSNQGETKIEFIEATLLSEAELEACEKYITRPAYFEPNYWYLRDACDDNQVAMACDNCVDEPSDPDYEDSPPNGPSGTGLRPIVRIKPCDRVKPGDKITITSSGYFVASFTAISDTILLSDFMIDYDYENNSYGIFDESTNVYEYSNAKKRVDAWYEDLLERIHDDDDFDFEDEEVSDDVLTRETVVDLFGPVEDIENVVIPAYYTVIGKGAFYGCTNLKSVEVHKGLERIEDNAFSHTSERIKIVYEGTGTQWDEIPKGENWEGPAEVDIWPQDMSDLFG